MKYKQERSCLQCIHRSLPSRERGLKLGRFFENISLALVAPFAGAWIEIEKAEDAQAKAIQVAPFAGAWIEISRKWRKGLVSQSLPSRERGLKWRIVLALSWRI